NPRSSSEGTLIAAASGAGSSPPSNTTISPSVRSGRGGTQSIASSPPIGQDRPSSSFSSRTAASRGDSPASTAPPGISQYGLYVGSTSSTRPAASKNRTPAPILLRGSVAV